MSGQPITTHPVSGYQGKGAKNSLCYIPHYYIPGLNTYAINTISNSDEAVQYYSAPDRFNLPVPYVAFLEIESSNINFIWFIIFRIYPFKKKTFIGINTVLDIVNLKTRWKSKNEKLLKKCQEKSIYCFY